MEKTVVHKLSLAGLLLIFGFITVHSESLDIPHEPTVSCPDGWVRIHRGCYKFETTGRNWEEAKDVCKAARGELTYIQSEREKVDLESHLSTAFPADKQWWIGFSREGTKGRDWRWLDDTPVSTLITPWVLSNMPNRPGNMCGMLEMKKIGTNTLHLSLTRCSSTLPFICEFHTITPRPETSTAPETTTLATTTEAPQHSPPLEHPFVSCEDCPCPNVDKAEKVDDADEVDDSSSEESNLSSENRLKKRNYEALHTGDELYRKYLQSEIDANNAKIAYYDEVSKLYEEALVAQSQYYNSYQTKLDLEIAQLREGSKCT